MSRTKEKSSVKIPESVSRDKTRVNVFGAYVIYLFECLSESTEQNKKAINFKLKKKK